MICYWQWKKMGKWVTNNVHNRFRGHIATKEVNRTQKKSRTHGELIFL